MQVLLLATVLIAAVWFVALRPKGSSDGDAAAVSQSAAPTAPGVKGLTTAIAKAHGAVATANGAAGKAAGAIGGSASATGSAQPATGGAAVPGTAAAPAHHVRSHHATRHHARHHAATRHHARHHAATRHHARHHASARSRRAHRATVHRVRLVKSALRHHKALAIAFVDPAAADSRAVAHELRHVERFHGRAVTLKVPLADLSRYGVITHDVQVTGAPTVVIVAPNGQATTIVGFATAVEIEQRLADALTQRSKRHT